MFMGLWLIMGHTESYLYPKCVFGHFMDNGSASINVIDTRTYWLRWPEFASFVILGNFTFVRRFKTVSNNIRNTPLAMKDSMASLTQAIRLELRFYADGVGKAYIQTKFMKATVKWYPIILVLFPIKTVSFTKSNQLKSVSIEAFPQIFAQMNPTALSIVWNNKLCPITHDLICHLIKRNKTTTKNLTLTLYYK